MVAKGKIVNTTPKNGWKKNGKLIKVVLSGGGAIQDPGLFHEHRRLRGPLIRATGPGSYSERDEQVRATLIEKLETKIEV